MKRRYMYVLALIVVGVVFLLTSPLLDSNEINDNKEEIGKPSEAKMEENQNREWIIAWEGKYDPAIEEQSTILTWDEKQKVTLVMVNPDIDQAIWSEKWKMAQGVRYIQPNYTYKVKSMPTDSFILKQTYLKQIGAYEGWDVRNSNTGIVIAIIDTGVDLNHPDLRNNLVGGINLVPKEGEKVEDAEKRPPQDDNGHGTQVAGILAAEGNNGIGVSGILWKAKVMPIKAMDANGDGKDYIVGRGIYEAVDRGAKIILLSLGDPIYSIYMKEAVDYAEVNGVLVVAATGNDYDRVNYPAAFPTVIAVGAVNTDDLYMSYSNSGPEVSVMAPGEGIYTTTLNGEYSVESGTSMAAPQVAGLAALILAKYPDMKPAQVRDFIAQSTVDVGAKGWDNKTGFGRISIS
ncbi:MAG: S8 family peptidase, partial [Bacilli bacterium]